MNIGKNRPVISQPDTEISFKGIVGSPLQDVFKQKLDSHLSKMLETANCRKGDKPLYSNRTKARDLITLLNKLVQWELIEVNSAQIHPGCYYYECNQVSLKVFF